MHIHLDDQYQHAATAVHELDPRVKLLLVIGYILAVALTPPGIFWGYLLLWLVLAFGATRAEIKLLYLIKRSVIALPFALAALTLPFTLPGDPLVRVGTLVISDTGAVRFAGVLLKSWISVQAAILLVSVTRFPDLLWSLQALRVPSVLVAIISFMYRYLFVLSDEALRLMRARSARSAAVPGRRAGGSVLWRGQVAGRMAGSLMIRSFERSERIYQAMAARGYRGEVRSLTRRSVSRGELTLLGIVGASLCVYVLAAYGVF